MAAKCCWSTSCPASARRHWLIARARARHERGRDDLTGSRGAAGLARPGRLGENGGYFRRSDRALASVVDVAGRHLRGCIAGRDGAASRRQGLPAVAEASDLLASDRAVCAGGFRNSVVGRALGCTTLRDRTDYETAAAAFAVLSF